MTRFVDRPYKGQVIDKMGGSTANGFQTRNGQVYYQLSFGDVEWLEAIELFTSKKIKEDECDKFLDDERLYEAEDSPWRIVRLIDGTILGKLWGMKGIFKYEEH